MSGGIPADVVNGETKADYINRLSVTNYGDFLCEKVNIQLNFKDLDQSA